MAWSKLWIQAPEEINNVTSGISQASRWEGSQSSAFREATFTWSFFFRKIKTICSSY
jgi:hypothetical protein